MPLLIDPARWAREEDPETGIYVRAQHPETGGWHSACLSRLDRASLVEWLAGLSSDGHRNIVLHFLGHPPLVEEERSSAQVDV